jgi:hypothetical protein
MGRASLPRGPARPRITIVCAAFSAFLGQAAPDFALRLSVSRATDGRLIIHVWNLSDCLQVLPCSYSQGPTVCYGAFAYRYPALLRRYPGPDKLL